MIKSVLPEMPLEYDTFYLHVAIDFLWFASYGFKILNFMFYHEIKHLIFLKFSIGSQCNTFTCSHPLSLLGGQSDIMVYCIRLVM